MSFSLSRAPLSGESWFAVEYEPTLPAVVLLDQRALPGEERYLTLRTPDEVAQAIRDMVVRGAPAIGITAAYGMVLQAQRESGDAGTFLVAMGIAGRGLGAARPTAVNLHWAIARMAHVAAEVAGLSPGERVARLQATAESIHRDDVEANQAMGRATLAELRRRVPGDRAPSLLTHCNTGHLATGGYGTALGAIRAAHAHWGDRLRVLATETRPYLQGARLTAWELGRAGIGHALITDGMPGHFMARGEVDAVIVGSDRIVANGDVANKIGTYQLAQLARAHGIPFLVVAPWSTVDLGTPTGAEIDIEARSSDEVAVVGGRRIAPAASTYLHPAFDVTPAALVTAIVTERGVMRPEDGDTPAGFLH